MNHFRLDAQLASLLQALPEPVKLCDPTGVIVGHFTPVKKGKYEVPFTDEEISASKQKPGGRPLADILADLERL